MEGKGPHVHSCILPGVDVQYGHPPSLLGLLGLMSAHEQLSLRGLRDPELVHNQTSFQTPCPLNSAFCISTACTPTPMWAVCVKSGGTGVLMKEFLGSDDSQCRTEVQGPQDQEYWAPWSWRIAPAGGIPGEEVCGY